jgi:hypothetical protein
MKGKKEGFLERRWFYKVRIIVVHNIFKLSMGGG